MTKSKVVDLKQVKKETLDASIKVPNKEIMMDKFELNILRGLDQKLGVLNNNLGALTRDYEMKKETLLTKGTKTEEKIGQYIETLKEKYKIISLKNIDFTTGKITMD